jgi:hypothetical protein
LPAADALTALFLLEMHPHQSAKTQNLFTTKEFWRYAQPKQRNQPASSKLGQPLRGGGARLADYN